jgi:hypothetical protein
MAFCWRKNEVERFLPAQASRFAKAKREEKAGLLGYSRTDGRM